MTLRFTKTSLIGAIAICATGVLGAANAQKDGDDNRKKSDFERLEEAARAIEDVKEDIDTIEEKIDDAQADAKQEIAAIKKDGVIWDRVRASLGDNELETLDRVIAVQKVARSSPKMRKLQSLQTKAKDSNAPMLAPKEIALADDSQMVALKNSYAMQSSSGSGAMTINGTCKAASSRAVKRLEKRSASAKRKAPAKLARMKSTYDVTRTEYGKEMSFSKFGCTYTITSICSRVTTPCPSDANMAKLADNIVLMNGK